MYFDFVTFQHCILVFRNHTEQNETKLDTYLINVTDEGQM